MSEANSTLLWVVGLGVAAGVGYYLLRSKSAAAATPPAQLPAPSPSPAPNPIPPIPWLGTQPTPPAPGSWGLPPIPPPSPAMQSAAANVASQGIPTNLVLLTVPVSGADLSTGTIRNFAPGEILNVYGTPVAGITTFTDTDNVPSHYFTTTTMVAGLFG